MSLPPVWRTRFQAATAAVLAIWLGAKIAQGHFFLPVLCLVALSAIFLGRYQSLPLHAWVLGGVTFGYIVGNRGFAQISVTGRIPLLPAEAALLVVGAIVFAQCSWLKRSPVRRDALNFAVLAWMLLSSARVYLDVQTFGVAAIRDYATVYYAAFFFLAQEAAREEPSRRFLHRCLLCGCATLAVVYPLYEAWPDFFLRTLTLRGIPLVFLKGDLVGTFLALGSVLFFLHYEKRRARWAWAVSLAMAALVVATENRASLLGLLFATGLLALGGRWRFAAVQMIGGTLAIVALLLFATATGRSWERTPLYGLYERVVSLTDPWGQRSYSGESSYFKGDNNVFRTTWWRICIEQTLQTDPWLGLGWGYDLAEPFARVYYPEGNDEFSARSPHSIVVTVFARTGVVGLVPFLALIGAMVVRTRHALRRGTPETAARWCGAWALLTSASFGVVLEGPMGAVVFWTLLGLANQSTKAEESVADTSNSAEIAAESVAALPSGERTPEMAAPSSS